MVQGGIYTQYQQPTLCYCVVFPRSACGCRCQGNLPMEPGVESGYKVAMARTMTSFRYR